MIVFDLICAARHRFEGWFMSGEEFGRQREQRLLSCPICATTEVEKLPTAKIKKGAENETVRPPASPAQPHEKQAIALANFIDLVLKNTEDVGQAFPEEARKIHYAEVPRRGIRGIATREEAADLTDEGIEVLPLPVPLRSDWH